ncbi:hypothetical protein LAZ67_1004962, partial [Cordylochernes scorpioides]
METLGVTQQAISNRLKVMGMVQKQGNWVPYELKPGNIERRICTCELLLKRQNRKGFLHRIVTGDEKWIHYDNPKRRKSSVKPGHASTSTAKPNIHGKKLMLCIWWDQLGVIYYELLQPNETITGERYQQQLMRLSRALKIKRPLYAKRHDKVIYQHDNARPHVAKVVKETLEALQWDVLPHPLYSPDIAPSDYHMFRSMTHGLAEQHFTSYEEAKNWVNVWIASKDEEYFRHGVRMLPERWEKVVAKDGQYFELNIFHIHVKCNSTCVRSVVMKSNREFENRAAIIVALRAGRSPKEIVDFLKLPKTTIYRVKKQFDEADSNKEGIATRKKHSRRSDRVRGEEFVKNVKEKIDGNPGKSMRAIAKEMDVGSMEIVRTIHEDLGLKSYALRKGQLLTENMKNNRKGKAAALLNNLKHDSFGMLRFFSDENNFDVDQKVNPRNDRWICKDPSEIPVVMHTKFPASVMVLGVISSEGDVMPPHFFEKGLRMNADTYINVLETVVKPWMHMAAAGRKYVFQQDSAPAHKAKKTQSWLTLNVPSHWGPDIWPPNSPDCNPLDYYVWGVVERDVNKAPHTTIQSVKKAVHTVMTQMDKYTCTGHDNHVGRCRRLFLLQHLSQEKKKKRQTIGRMEAGQSQAEVARWLGVTRNVVSRLWKKFQTTANVARTPGQGRPSVTTLNQDRYLSILVRRNRRMTASQLRSDLNAATGVLVSTDTIRRRLHKKGLYARRPIICVPLTPPQKRARKLWCRQHVAWNPDEWRRVMFTDESRFSLNSDSRRVFVWREVGTRNNPRNMVERDPYRSQGFMVWAGIFLGGRTALHIFRQGTLTGQRYRDEILAAYVMPQALEMGENFLLMDDNARPHRAGVVDTFLQNHAIARMNWPARSPDLNPIEHVWDNLGRRISSLQLPPRNTHELETALTQERQRLEWCRARSTWMTEWHRVVFSDESRFCLSSDSRRVRVWRRRGERSNPAAIVERPTVRQRGITVWGAIAYDSSSPLLRIQGIMTAQRYVDDVLRPVTLPYLQGVPNVFYQQDNPRPHTARISQQALQDVQMLPWPPYSPDLSPIEHVWDIIGRRLHALPQPRSEDELWQMVEREWRAIPQDAIRTLIDSLPRRVAACIAVRG